MDAQQIIQELSPDSTDEEQKNKIIKDILPGLEDKPDENVIQALMRIIRKPTISEASNEVYDNTVMYLKSINRY